MCTEIDKHCETGHKRLLMSSIETENQLSFCGSTIMVNQLLIEAEDRMGFQQNMERLSFEETAFFHLQSTCGADIWWRTFRGLSEHLSLREWFISLIWLDLWKRPTSNEVAYLLTMNHGQLSAKAPRQSQRTVAIMEVVQTRGLTLVIGIYNYDLHSAQYMQLALFSYSALSSLFSLVRILTSGSNMKSHIPWISRHYVQKPLSSSYNISAWHSVVYAVD